MKYALTMAALALLESARAGAKPGADGMDPSRDDDGRDGRMRDRAAAPLPARPGREPRRPAS
jgi:hypothetical protein